MTDAAAGAGAPRTNWVVPLLVLIAGMFMSVLDTSIVNVALPTMARDFGVTTEDIEWVSTGYTLALGVIVPLSAWLGDRMGLSRVYLWCVVLFAVASALCGFAWDLTSEIVFRIVQAVPGGVLPVVTLSLVYKIVPKDRIGTAMGLYGVGVLFAPAIGPTLGGYLVEYVDWRLVYFINVPIGALAAVLAFVLLPATPPTSTRRFDWLGFLTIAYALFALLLAFTEGQSWGWTSYRIMILLVSGALSLALFVVVELELDEPLVDLRVFTHWQYVNSLLLISILSVGLFVVLFYLPQFMQNVQGIEPLRAGVILLPEALVMMVVIPIAGRLYDRFGPRWPAVAGLALATVGTVLLCGITPDMTEGQTVLWSCIRSAGNALALMPIMTAGLASIPEQYSSSGSAFNNIAQRVASSLGLAGLGVLISDHQDQQLADRAALLATDSLLPSVQRAVEHGYSGIYPIYQRLELDVVASAYSDAFLVCAAITALGIVLALFMRKPQLAPASTPPVPMTVEGMTKEGMTKEGVTKELVIREPVALPAAPAPTVDREPERVGVGSGVGD